MTHLQLVPFRKKTGSGSDQEQSSSGHPKPETRDPREDKAFYTGVSMIVASAFETEPTALFAPTRCRARTALARQVAVYLVHVVGSKSYTEIGRVFGRDRTTAAYACRVVEDRRDDPVFDRLVEQLERAINQWSRRVGVSEPMSTATK